MYEDEEQSKRDSFESLLGDLVVDIPCQENEINWQDKAHEYQKEARDCLEELVRAKEECLDLLNNGVRNWKALDLSATEPQ